VSELKVGQRVLVRTKPLPVLSDVYECEVEEVSTEYVKLTDADGDSCWHRPEDVVVIDVLKGRTEEIGY
jgi:hypothetical protein